jgi:FtsP/CotA-like multicopper oxidase with cupredoxin domain
VSALALALAACGDASRDAAAPPAVAPADLVLRGGKVATVDPAFGNAEALAVNGYQVTAVGNNQEISAYIGPECIYRPGDRGHRAQWPLCDARLHRGPWAFV